MPTPCWMDQTTSEEFSWSRVLGGIRDVTEATVPGLPPVIVLVVTRDLLPTLIMALTVALIVCVIRFIQHQGIGQAPFGPFGVAIGVILTVVTGHRENYPAWGIATNMAMVFAFAPPVLCGRSLVTQSYGPLTGLAKGWQSDPAYAPLRHNCAVITWIWAGTFVLRVAVQASLWLAGQVADPGVPKLAFGLPLFAAGA